VGTVLSVKAETPVLDGTAKRWVFRNWTGDVTPSPNISNPLSVTMDQPRSLTANYVVQYLLTFTQSGITGNTGGNTVFTVDSATPPPAQLTYAKAALPTADLWFDGGTTVTYHFSASVLTDPVSATQFVLMSITGGPATQITNLIAPATITGNYSAFAIQYLQPLDQTTTGVPVNTGKNGRVIPVKVQLYEDGVPLTSSNIPGPVTIKVVSVACPGSVADSIEEFADAGSSNANTNLFRWSTDGFWIYNLDTTGLHLVTNNCYRLDVYIGSTPVIYASAGAYALFKPTK
jgi:hypothetical protein